MLGSLGMSADGRESVRGVRFDQSPKSERLYGWVAWVACSRGTPRKHESGSGSNPPEGLSNSIRTASQTSVSAALLRRNPL